MPSVSHAQIKQHYYMPVKHINKPYFFTFDQYMRRFSFFSNKNKELKKILFEGSDKEVAKFVQEWARFVAIQRENTRLYLIPSLNQYSTLGNYLAKGDPLYRHNVWYPFLQAQPATDEQRLSVQARARDVGLKMVHTLDQYIEQAQRSVDFRVFSVDIYRNGMDKKQQTIHFVSRLYIGSERS